MIVWHSTHRFKDRPDPDTPLLREPRCVHALRPTGGAYIAVQALLPAREKGKVHVFATHVSSFLIVKGVRICEAFVRWLLGIGRVGCT